LYLLHISAPGHPGVLASIYFLQFQTISEDGDENKNGKIAETQHIRFCILFICIFVTHSLAFGTQKYNRLKDKTIFYHHIYCLNKAQQ
jgi:hypothetical protein